MNRRAFITSLAATGAGLAGAYAFLIGPNWLDVTRHAIGAGGAHRRPLSFVQLSDLHLPSHLGYLEEKVAETVHALAPDFIVITGDAVDERGRLDVLAAFLDRLPHETKKYATLGNWEHWAGVDLDALFRTYAQAGSTLLINETAVYRKGEARVLLTGLDDATAGRPDMHHALTDVQPAEHHLVLAHSPAYRDQLIRVLDTELDRYTPAYMLSGHTHGGQVDLFGYKPFLPRGTGGYVEGWFTERRPHLYVSRGIGTSVLPVRFCARPEVAYFTLRV